jgi:hypothetical protein
MRAAWLGAVGCLLTVAIGWGTLAPLPPTVSFVYLVPLVLAGIGLVLQSTAGRGLGTLGTWVGEDSWLHVPLVLLGWTLIAVGTTGLLRLPSAATVQLARLTTTLPTFCAGPAAERVERDLLPTLEAVDMRMEVVVGPVHDDAERALRTTLPRCVDRLAEAAVDPAGTHTSWRLLRDWLVAHPDWVTVPPDLASRPLPPRTHRPKPRPVQVDL